MTSPPHLRLCARVEDTDTRKFSIEQQKRLLVKRCYKCRLPCYYDPTVTIDATTETIVCQICVFVIISDVKKWNK